jgi:alpha-L-fucosidase
MNKTTAFEPTWESLCNYTVPDWFRDAKFGIWAHWGPQCQPARGDWYARGMYIQGEERYREHIEQYDHPSRFGFKDVINEWKATNWNPEEIVALYKRTGAEYFVALANHHDNLDLWDSTHQTWNTTVVGPKRNIIEDWARAAESQQIRFGVSVHASHAWSWYEPAQGSDLEGPLAGVPYDGTLTEADGVGTWWDGLDPQDLYAQNHEATPMEPNMWSVLPHWEWGNNYPAPSTEYCEKFFDRTIELIDKYKPDLVYFDDTVFPLYPVSDAGLRIASHYYNTNPNAVINGKVLSELQKKAMVWDIERGLTSDIEPLPWQTCTCLGDWHYKQSIFDNDGYKSSFEVIQMLVDVVSKNGNLLLSVPLTGDGTLDHKEIAILEEIGLWMATNRESIVETRPWIVSGEGPSSGSVKPLTAQGFNEGSGIPNTVEDIRFTQKGNTLYVTVLAKPEGTVRVKSLGTNAGLLTRPILSIRRLGSDAPLPFNLAGEALEIGPTTGGSEAATVFRIDLAP